MENRDGQSRSWSYPNYRDYRDRATLVDVVAQDDVAMSVAVDGRAERAYGGMVSGNYFQFMGVQPALGRLIGPEDDRTAGAHPVAVLSHAYWQRRFAGAPDIVGTQVTINNTPMTVIGVAADGFMGSFLGVSTAAWVPMAMQPQMRGTPPRSARQRLDAGLHPLHRAGASPEQAQAEAATRHEPARQRAPAVVRGLAAAPGARRGRRHLARLRCWRRFSACCRSWSRWCC